MVYMSFYNPTENGVFSISCDLTYTCTIYDFVGDESKTLFRLLQGFDYFSKNTEFRRYVPFSTDNHMTPNIIVKNLTVRVMFENFAKV